jgi:hypothetical protein
MDYIVTSLTMAEPGSVIKSAIKVMHLLGIILGLGAATVLDLVILKFLISGKIKHEHVAVVEFVSKIVTAGLVILWLSGLSYLLHYAVFDPAKLANQKVWAKIIIVAMLTVNGYFIHHRVLPLIKRQVGGALFRGLADDERAMMITFGTISATSWYVPLVLGAMPQLNFVVPASSILSAYAVVLAIAIASTQGIAHRVWRNEPDPDAEINYARLMQRVAETVGAASRY